VIYYASRTLNGAQLNYSTTEKEFYVVVFALEKFCSYLVGSLFTVYTNHAALKYLLAKKDAKGRLIRWILLLHEFDLQIRDKKGTDNLMADHMSHLPNAPTSNVPINENFPDEQLLANLKEPWFADIVNYLVTRKIPANWSTKYKHNFHSQLKYFYWNDPYLWKHCADQFFQRCVTKEERSILSFCHDQACGGHFGARKTAEKVVQCGFYWSSLFKDAYEFYE